MPANKSYKQRWITPGSVSFYRSCRKALIRLLVTRLPAFPVGAGAARGGGRALLNPCSLLLLDEPAASLDAHSEQRVMEALNTASLRQTTLMVTHQLEDLADWDVIWVMQDGQIIEQGRYAELSVAGGPFATLLAHRQEEI
ncbi:ABC transporter ATP-binding protein/permease [Escherichia coli]|uniref:ABC transporter ATP-binding protein/permease n=1 Tax=Escherichia coli TaxID=562 RepID=A0A484WPB6_ECOLX|nr:ABC transporter ATP-binding protein/permease [Escherichia coli]